MNQKFSVQVIDLLDIFEIDPFGFPSGGIASLTLPQIIELVVTLAIGAIVLAWVILAAIIGIKYITSRGDQQEVEAASKSLKNLLIGSFLTFAVLIVIYFIIQLFT
ncbi:MAG: hypothetical protein ACOCXP_01200 [Candidatus Dojkabacteria bacterium]